MKKITLFVLLALCGCETTQSDRPKTLPVGLHAKQLTIPLEYDGSFNFSTVQQAVADLGGHREAGAYLIGLAPDLTEQIFPRLVAAGLDPDRVHVTPLVGHVEAMPPRLVISSIDVAVPNCSKVIKTGWLGNVSPSLENVGNCVQNNNLAQMLADPRDLYSSPSFHPSPAARAALAVHRLNTGAEPALPADKLNNGLSNANTMGAGGGTTTDTQSTTSLSP